MITVTGKCGIRVTVLAYSINEMGDKLITYEMEYPRLILAELNTHCMLARNSFSSRAVPFNKMVEQLNGRPVRFGANQAGMQDKGEDFDALVDAGEMMGLPHSFLVKPEMAWEIAKDNAVKAAKAFYRAGFHKQVYNRLTEASQMMKTVLSATELPNFWWLRDDLAADPTLAELARCMREAMEQSTPTLLKPGMWHLPYVDYYEEVIGYEEDGDTPIYGPQMFYIGDMLGSDFEALTLEEAIKVSCARCAAVSYRNEGYGLEKSLEVYDRLVGSDKKHASAFEHQATVIRPWGYYDSDVTGTKVQYNHPWIPYTWEEGITHVDRKGRLWSAKFKGFVQYRKMIPGENYTGA